MFQFRHDAQTIPASIRFDMIAAVPEIVDDANHGIMADLLVDWLQREPSASPVLLDTLGNLSVPAEQSRQIVDSIL